MVPLSLTDTCIVLGLILVLWNGRARKHRRKNRCEGIKQTEYFITKAELSLFAVVFFISNRTSCNNKPSVGLPLKLRINHGYTLEDCSHHFLWSFSLLELQQLYYLCSSTFWVTPIVTIQKTTLAHQLKLIISIDDTDQLKLMKAWHFKGSF